jgi:hypothetical protein
LTIRELMEEQRKRVRSCNPAERLAAALLIPAELSRRLRLLGNSEIAQLLDEEVCENMSILAPEAIMMAEQYADKRGPRCCGLVILDVTRSLCGESFSQPATAPRSLNLSAPE